MTRKQKLKQRKKIKLKKENKAHHNMDLQRTVLPKSTSMYLTCDDGKASSATQESLQESFLNFRRQKQADVSLASSSRPNDDAQRILSLRSKFLQQCKKYIGVPYKQKYHEPGSPEYCSKLFLDCCGLVRRALRDLHKDFGFRIGPWNQAYMFDTLPLVVESESDMMPGDLVFISGRYYNGKMRNQFHDVVHVEVWLGKGIKTIGARWHRGKVQIFDSYKFQSTSYHSMKYHFRSIDTWLQGICRSFCDRHTWRRRGEFRPTKRSVFFEGQSSTTLEPNSTCSDDVSIQDSCGEDASDDEAVALLSTQTKLPRSRSGSPRQVAGNVSSVKSHRNDVERNEMAESLATEQEFAHANEAVKFVTFVKTICSVTDSANGTKQRAGDSAVGGNEAYLRIYPLNETTGSRTRPGGKLRASGMLCDHVINKQTAGRDYAGDPDLPETPLVVMGNAMSNVEQGRDQRQVNIVADKLSSEALHRAFAELRAGSNDS